MLAEGPFFTGLVLLTEGPFYTILVLLKEAQFSTVLVLLTEGPFSTDRFYSFSSVIRGPFSTVCGSYP